MASGEALNPESGSFHAQEPRPSFYIGQHDSKRFTTLTDIQYSQVLNTGVSRLHPVALL